MVAGRDAKINRTSVALRAFSLIETLLACALLALLAGFTFALPARITGRFIDPYSPYYVEREARDTADWIFSLMRRALLERRDFVLELYGAKPNPRIRVKWTNPSETVDRRSECIAYRVSITNSTNPPEQFHYSHRYQTMSPAFEFMIFAQTPESGVTNPTEWSIVVSLYGLVRISQQNR